MNIINRREWAIDEARAVLDRHGVSPEQFAVAAGVIDPAERQPLNRLTDRAGAAAFLGVCERTVTNLVADGLLPVVNVLGARKYDMRALAEFIEAHTSKRGTGVAQTTKGDVP